MKSPKTTACRCPYCAGPTDEDRTICTPCSVKIRFCPTCGTLLPQGSDNCPECASSRTAGRKRKQQ